MISSLGTQGLLAMTGRDTVLVQAGGDDASGGRPAMYNILLSCDQDEEEKEDGTGGHSLTEY